MYRWRNYHEKTNELVLKIEQSLTFVNSYSIEVERFIKHFLVESCRLACANTHFHFWKVRIRLLFEKTQVHCADIVAILARAIWPWQAQWLTLPPASPARWSPLRPLLPSCRRLTSSFRSRSAGKGRPTAAACAKKVASGRMQRPPELVPIPECCLNAAWMLPECCLNAAWSERKVRGKFRQNLVNI